MNRILTLFAIVASSAVPQELQLLEQQAKRVAAQAGVVRALPEGSRQGATGTLRRVIQTNLPALVGVSFHAAAAHAENERLDKQIGAAPKAPGATSLVSKGSVPALLGLAVENGAATRDVNGTTATFRLKPAALLNAIARGNYLLAGPVLIDPVREQALTSSLLYRVFERASLSLSFDLDRGVEPGTFTGRNDQIAQYSFRYELVNRRDPRDPYHLRRWLAVRDREATAASDSATLFFGELAQTTFYLAWLDATTAAVLNATTDQEAEAAYRRQLQSLSTQIRAIPSLEQLRVAATRDFTRLIAVRDLETDYMLNSPIVTVEYAVTRQKPEQLDAPDGAAVSPALRALPELRTIRFIAGGRVVPGSKAEFTLNVSGTRFGAMSTALPTGTPLLPVSGTAVGKWRDWQAGIEFDFPLRELQGIGKPDLALSARFVQLREQPLGEKLLINNVPVDTRGNIWVGQGRLTIRVGDSGVQVPLSLTMSNRSELLVNERDIRGSIGVTFDLDKVFARGTR